MYNYNIEHCNYTYLYRHFRRISYTIYTWQQALEEIKFVVNDIKKDLKENNE